MNIQPRIRTALDQVPALGVPFCWHCGKALMSRRNGEFSYRLVRDPCGHEHRVHGSCLFKAIGGGVVAVGEAWP